MVLFNKGVKMAGKRASIYMGESLLEQAKEEATAQHRSLSSFVEIAVMKHLHDCNMEYNAKKKEGK